jgi:SAM-dependent methyltransferase
VGYSEATVSEQDYVLGTNDEEIDRLGLQHLVWRPWMLAAWRRAHVTRGSRVLDVGAGPGFATADLAEVVGPHGEVLAVERSARFIAAARRRCAERGLENIRVEELDLMIDPIPATAFDAAWCRWVACFVSSPIALVEAIARALRPGGTVVFHEYGNYGSWRLMPPRPALNQFVDAVTASWRSAGGEPDIGLTLPTLLRQVGFCIREVRPLVFAVSPRDFVWQWPSTFLKSGAVRLRELGHISGSDLEMITREFADAERDPTTVMMTPLVLEIIATKPRLQPIRPS